MLRSYFPCRNDYWVYSISDAGVVWNTCLWTHWTSEVKWPHRHFPKRTLGCQTCALHSLSKILYVLMTSFPEPEDKWILFDAYFNRCCYNLLVVTYCLIRVPGMLPVTFMFCVGKVPIVHFGVSLNTIRSWKSSQIL